MKYYVEEHESGYEKIKAEGKTNWDQLHGSSGFNDFAMCPIFEKSLPLLNFPVSQPRALEYGCGTGPGACFLAARGFQVDGIDISALAIEMAKEFAAQRHLKINYEVSDICKMPIEHDFYDLIVDNFCLQCIVTDLDREKLFSAVLSRLNPHGYYLIGTAIFNTERRYDGHIFDEKTGISYISINSNEGQFEDAVKIADGWYLPSRRHLKPHVLRDELKEAGFTILWHSKESQNMGLLCQRANS